jgi:hypothetical protein
MLSSSTASSFTPTPVSMPSEEYTIIVRDERFVLSHDQLYFDAPNYFTLLFCDSGFSEATNDTKEAVLHRDPHLFQVIQTYLSGYVIMPLPESWFPQYMSKEAALLNLLADAKFYGLERLVKILKAQPTAQRVGSFPLKRGGNIYYSMFTVRYGLTQEYFAV